MANPKERFIKNRLRSILFSLRGILILIKTEKSIQVQVIIAIFITLVGWYFSLSTMEWIAQCIVIGLVITAESLNTAIEKIADFIHPDYHKKIGSIKDVSAGAVGLAAIISLVVAGIIYIPKIQQLF